MKKSLFYLGILIVPGSLSQLKAQTKKVTDSVRNVDEVVLLGSRSTPRTQTESPVPVDIFNLKKEGKSLPQTQVSQILNYLAPSFTSSVQTNADGTDHLDPAQLRGLGPDQVLVLINGKRRHTSSLVNVNGTTGRGSVGTDLNAIPSFALSNIEILRDGAAAQYGSDAISGVINLGLKRDTDHLTGQISTGTHLTPAARDHRGGTDGESIQLDLNYGSKVGTRGGFINLTWSFQNREKTYRAGSESGNLFNAYNAIEERARRAGTDLSYHFSNINNLSIQQAKNLIENIHKYANDVGYFSTDYLNKIHSESNIPKLQELLRADYTEQELAYRGLDRKDFNMQVGQSKLINHQTFINAEIPIIQDWKLYTFGGYSLRQGEAGGFYRKPNQARTFTSLYPNGFLPKIQTAIEDISFSTGLKGKLANWEIDFSNSFGQNSFDYIIANSSNTSLRFQSPKKFNAGGLRFRQNTLNIDISRSYDILDGLNVALGAEHRIENYNITGGQPESYTQYDIYGRPLTSSTPALNRPTDFFGNLLPGGSQVFGGFRAANALSRQRQSLAGYLDTELKLNSRILLTGALRYENYSDFGNTLNYKLATQVKISPQANFRLAGSTGFRAPSIQQIYFNSTSTIFINQTLQEVGTFSNDSYIARQLLGIPPLKQETSKSISGGLTWRVPSIKLSLTADAYWIRIDNRVVLTDIFRRQKMQASVQLAYDTAGIDAAQFFTNAIDTETQGFDLVISHRGNLGSGWTIDNNLGANLNKTRQVGDIHRSGLLDGQKLDNIYFSERSRVFLEEAVPRVKASLAHTLNKNKFKFYLRNTFFGSVTSPDAIDLNMDGIVDISEHQTITDRILTDISITYNLNKNLAFTIGANNIFDQYPTRNFFTNTNNDQFVYSRSTSQFGQNGRYVFARLNFGF